MEDFIVYLLFREYVIHIAAAVQIFIKDETGRILTFISRGIVVNEKEYNLKIWNNFKKN